MTRSLGFNPGPFEYRSPERSGVWTPTGPLENPFAPGKTIWKSGTRQLVARIFVGFNVCDKPRWTMDDLVPIVKEIRTEQANDPGASFVVQKGLYRDSPTEKDPRDCGIIEEDSAQVVIYESAGQRYEDFKVHMLELAGEIARRFEQRSVILEFQRGGKTIETLGVAP